MKKLEKWINADTVFTWMRAAVVAAGVVGTLIALWLGLLGVSVFLAGMDKCGLDMSVCDWKTAFAALAGLAAVLATSGCCYVALISVYRMCGRLKQGSAFTERNARAMARIAGAFVIGGASIAAATAVLMICGLAFHLSAYVLLIVACLFFGLSLISYALCLLVRRAAALQQENDLTI